MKNKQLKLGAVISYATIAFNIIAGLIYTPWLISTIGDDHYALYTLALSIIHIFMMDFGIGSAVTKYLSNYYAQGKHEEANRFMGIVYKTFLVISGVIALCLLVFYFQIDWIYTKFTPDELLIFKRLFIVVASYSVFSFPFTTFNGILLANEKFIALKCCSFGQKVLDVALIILLLLLGQGVYALVLVHAFSNVVFLAAKYLIIRRKTALKVDMRSWDGQTAKGLFNFSAWYTVMNLARRCIYNIMPSVIAALSGSLEVTLFSLASTLEGYAFNFTDAINGMFMPKVSRIVNSKDYGQNLEELMIKVARFHIYTLGLLILGFFCVGRQFIDLWLGEGYEIVYACALLLLLPSLIDTPQQIARTSLVVKDVVREQAILYVAMAAVNLVLAFVLIPGIGVLGAAISVGSSYCLKVLGLNWMYRKHLPIRLWRYFREAYGRWLIPAALTLLFGVFMDDLIPLTGWLGLLLKAVLIAGLYCLLVFGLCMDKTARKAVCDFLLRRKK